MRNEILNTIIIHNNPVEAQKTEKLIKRLYIDTIVILVNSIEEAQHIIKSLKPDLILLDENSIKNSQVNLCKDLRVGPDCEDFMIIMLTSESNEEYLKNIIEKGCDAYLLNPINEISLWIQMQLSLKIKKIYNEKTKEIVEGEKIREKNTEGLEDSEQPTLQLLSNLQNEIEARKISENDLRTSELRLSRAEIASKSGNWELDLNNQTITASAGALAIYGTKSVKPQYDIIKTVPLDNYREVLDKALIDLVAGRTPYNVVYKIKRLDNGNIINIHSVATYNKKSNKVFGVIRDITDEVMTQEALHQSESLYKAILDSSPEDISVTDLSGNILMCSKSIVRTYGFENEADVIGQNILNYFAIEDLERLRIDFTRLINSGVSSGLNEYKTTRRDGSSFDIEVMSGLIRDSNGEISKLLFMARDISERKRIEQRILKSEIELSTMWNFSPNGLGIIDENGSIIRVNKALTTIFEKSEDDLVGKTIKGIVPSQYKENIIKIFKHHFENRSLENHIEMEFDIQNDKNKWLQLDFAFLDFENEKSVLLAIINDITERKSAEKKVRNLTRLYALLGQINQAIVRQSNDLELMQQICDVAIEYGEFKFAWFAEYKQANQAIKHICESGKNNNYIEKIKDQFTHVNVYSKTYSNIIENKEIACCNDLSQENDMLFKPSEALKNDFHSMAVLPIQQKGVVKYLLYLYSDKKDFFNKEEQKLLSEIAQDISHAAETIEAEKVRVETENALLESENRYNAFINNNVDMIFVKDNQLRYLVVNESFANFLGLKQEHILNKTDKDIADKDLYIPCLQSDKSALLQDTPLVVFEEFGDRIFETTKFKMPLKDGQFGIGGIMHDITHRKKQEIALEESRLELQSIYDNAPVLMCVLDENKKILFKNQEFKRFFNIPEHLENEITLNDILGCNKKDLPYKVCEDLNCDTCKVQRAIEKTLIEGSTQRNFEYHSSHNANGSGEEIYLLGSSSLINSSGNRKILLTFNDITNRKKAETALTKSNKRFELAMNVANMAWWETDLKTTKVYFDKRKTELLGYTPEHFKNYEDFFVLIHPGDQKEVMDCFENHIKGYTDKIEVEYRIRTKSGKYRYFYDIGSISKRNSVGEPLVISGLILDITERKISDEALEKSEMFLRTFINNTPFQIWARDENNIGILENKMLVDNFGSILGKKPSSDTRVPHELAINWENQNNLVLQGGIIDEEIEFRKDGKSIDYQQIIFPINLNNRIIGIAGFSIDITERKRSQIALRESREQLKKFAAHLQYIREEERVSLSREIHDELGQILVAIKFDLGMLKQKIQNSSDDKDLELLDHLSKLVDNTLMTARRIMTDLRPELLDMLGFVDALKSHIKSFIERQHIKCIFESKITDLQIDSQRSVALFRIFQESLNNISKHAKATKIVVKLEKLKDNYYYLEIADNGCGFDMSKDSRSDSYGLLGMRERAYLLDAKLNIKSEPNKGTTIRIDFKV